MEWPLAIELLVYTQRALDSIKKLTQLSQVKYTDKRFGEFFYHSIMKDIGETNLLLEAFLQYPFVNTPLKRKDTIHKLIDEVLRKYRVRLEEKRVNLSKKYEKDLPETIIPNEPLNYILNSILQYGLKAVTLNGDMEWSTRSLLFKRKVSVGQKVSRKNERYIEIKVVFTDYKKRGRRFEGSQAVYQGEPLDLILRLAEEVVRKNRGIMEFKMDERSEKASISIRFPSERREGVYYQPIDQYIN
jgi:glycyl-tRNA synthetase beta subunit